ncbi:fasciclin domain-containing protein [Rufibacter roseus]|nr:fasciclin domain-containing protein [Rufibacter roseus]
MSEFNRTETSAMAGDAAMNDLDVLVIEEQVMVPLATLSVTALPMTNSVDIDDMFDNVGDTESYTTFELAKKSPNLSTFVMLIERANLADDLERVENLTLFAPTNEAFAKLPKEKLQSLLSSENTALLSSVLQAHILASDVSSARLDNNTRIRVSDKSYIPVDRTMSGTVTTVGGAQIVKSDVEASNGRIHVIDSVILPSENILEDNNSLR